MYWILLDITHVHTREGCQALYFWYSQDNYWISLRLPLHLKGAAWLGRAQVFFCKYNDPIYVKMEKLEIMIALASDRNVDQVLLEFKEYATEVDVDFVRKASPAHSPIYENFIAGLWMHY